MSDKVSLLVDDRKIEDFLSYRVDSDIFIAADAFSFELADPKAGVKAGSRCKLFVNDRLELNGIVDQVSASYDKSGVRVSVGGRDLMGLLVDSSAEEYGTFEKITLDDLAKKLTKPLKYINRVRVEYGKGGKNASTVQAARSEEFKLVQIEPGQTVFNVLKHYALARGLLFFCMPDGTLVFREPLTSGPASFSISHRDVLSGSLQEDISRRYSKVTAIGQRQGSDELAPEEINVTGTVEDEKVPLYKPLVAVVGHDGEDATKHARVLMEKRRFKSFSLKYKVMGHSRNNANWQANSICHVSDEALDLNDDFLIYGRTFQMSKEAGSTTSLRLSKRGMLPEDWQTATERPS